MIMLDLDVFAIQPNFVIGSIDSKLNAFVIDSLLKFLDMVEVFLTNNHQFS